MLVMYESSVSSCQSPSWRGCCRDSLSGGISRGDDGVSRPGGVGVIVAWRCGVALVIL